MTDCSPQYQTIVSHWSWISLPSFLFVFINHTKCPELKEKCVSIFFFFFINNNNKICLQVLHTLRGYPCLCTIIIRDSFESHIQTEEISVVQSQEIMFIHFQRGGVRDGVWCGGGGRGYGYFWGPHITPGVYLHATSSTSNKLIFAVIKHHAQHRVHFSWHWKHLMKIKVEHLQTDKYKAVTTRQRK